MITTLKVRDMMEHDFHSLPPYANIAEAARLLVKHRLSSIPVVDECALLCGMLTGRDCTRAIVHNAYSDVPGGDIQNYMSAPAPSIPEHATLLQAAAEFEGIPFLRLPVIDDKGHLVGILNRSDVLRCHLEQVAVGELFRSHLHPSKARTFGH